MCNPQILKMMVNPVASMMQFRDQKSLGSESKTKKLQPPSPSYRGGTSDTTRIGTKGKANKNKQTTGVE